MTNGTIVLITGIVLAIAGTVAFISLKIWLHSYGKRVKKDLEKRYGHQTGGEHF